MVFAAQPHAIAGQLPDPGRYEAAAARLKAQLYDSPQARVRVLSSAGPPVDVMLHHGGAYSARERARLEGRIRDGASTPAARFARRSDGSSGPGAASGHDRRRRSDRIRHRQPHRALARRRADRGGHPRRESTPRSRRPFAQPRAGRPSGLGGADPRPHGCRGRRSGRRRPPFAGDSARPPGAAAGSPPQVDGRRAHANAAARRPRTNSRDRPSKCCASRTRP